MLVRVQCYVYIHLKALLHVKWRWRMLLMDTFFLVIKVPALAAHCFAYRPFWTHTLMSQIKTHSWVSSGSMNTLALIFVPLGPVRKVRMIGITYVRLILWLCENYQHIVSLEIIAILLPDNITKLVLTFTQGSDKSHH